MTNKLTYYIKQMYLKQSSGPLPLRGMIFYFLIGLAILSGGCKKWLELDPTGEIIEDNFWRNEADVTAIVGGCYKSFTEDAVMQRLILWGEGRSDNVLSTLIDENFRRMVNMDLTPTNSYCTWGPFYKVINYCNTFLEKAPAVKKSDPNFTEADYLSLEAEVLSIRSLAYFYLVRAFRNVPWIDKATLSDDQNFNITQSSDTFVIAKITNDLITALVHAPESYSNTVSNNSEYLSAYNKGRVTKNMIKALLADIYLWNQQYDKCVQMCNEIIDSKKYVLYDYEHYLTKVFYDGNSTESIFELQFGESGKYQQPNNVVNAWYNLNFLPDLVFSPVLTPGTTKSPFKMTSGTMIESENDTRYKDFIDSKSGLFYFIFKYTGIRRTEDIINSISSYEYPILFTSSNWIVYRLADVMLMKAEALVQLNRGQEDLEEAMRMINTTYLRSNPKLLNDSLSVENYPTQSDMVRLVLRERQRELLFEGKRYFDLMRYAIRNNSAADLVTFVSEKLSGNTTQIGAKSIIDAIYLPVNSDVLAKSPSLKQNPYYVSTSSVTTN